MIGILIKILHKFHSGLTLKLIISSNKIKKLSHSLNLQPLDRQSQQKKIVDAEYVKYSQRNVYVN